MNCGIGAFDLLTGTTLVLIYHIQTQLPMSLLGQSSYSGLTVDLLIGLSILGTGERPRSK